MLGTVGICAAQALLDSGAAGRAAIFSPRWAPPSFAFQRGRRLRSIAAFVHTGLLVFAFPLSCLL